MYVIQIIQKSWNNKFLKIFKLEKIMALRLIIRSRQGIDFTNTINEIWSLTPIWTYARGDNFLWRWRDSYV